jgi:ABC-type multidrug transport system fused ATPase/permease subunit
LQGQVATSMRGSLRYNLLFGIEEHNFTDEYLTLVLERVGLWNIFQPIGGLDTFVGESGMNLSGGQRQRLNFANLYLRAIFYQPQVVLIDEPTSSLDEVSEQAITQMIIEIAQNAVTLVIAHRLKTLESAIAILDFSTLQESTNLEFVPVKLLKKSSKYFQMLLQNKIELTD